jgi:hypothetical protein
MLRRIGGEGGLGAQEPLPHLGVALSSPPKTITHLMEGEATMSRKRVAALEAPADCILS